MAEKIFIRNTISGQTTLMSPQMLDHPAFKDIFEEVRTDKPVNADLHTPRSAQRLTEPAADAVANYYEQFTISELQSEIDTRNEAGSDITVDGTLKADYIAALDADDIATAEKGNN
jgi:hypothetical protein